MASHPIEPTPSDISPSSNENCRYVAHPNGIHEMILIHARTETVGEMLLLFSEMYAATIHQDRQLILIYDQTKTGLPLTPLFVQLRHWLRDHPLHPNPRVAVLFGYNNIFGIVTASLRGMGISPRRITMWKPKQREQAIAWLLSDHL